MRCPFSASTWVCPSQFYCARMVPSAGLFQRFSLGRSHKLLCESLPRCVASVSLVPGSAAAGRQGLRSGLCIFLLLLGALALALLGRPLSSPPAVATTHSVLRTRCAIQRGTQMTRQQLCRLQTNQASRVASACTRITGILARLASISVHAYHRHPCAPREHQATLPQSSQLSFASQPERIL